MKVHISIDMEGIAGIADAADTIPGAPHFSYSRELMTGECNAAIAGCFDGGITGVFPAIRRPRIRHNHADAALR